MSARPLESDWNTMLLLRSWSIWRARLEGWARRKEYRQREVQRQVAVLTTDIRRAHEEHELHLREPLLISAEAHSHLSKWVPDVVQSVLQ